MYLASDGNNDSIKSNAEGILSGNRSILLEGLGYRSCNYIRRV